MQATEGMKWSARAILRKYTADIEEYRRRYGCLEGERLFDQTEKPFEEMIVDGNLLLDEGIEELFKLLIGAAATVYSNANARLGVGDSSAAAVRTQTDLQAAVNKLYKAMDATYPIVGATADHKVTFRSSFGAGEANFAWEEWTIDNGAADALNLNRKVQSFGTKSGGTWQLTVEVSLT